ncbi:MAG: DEAD/DEAH box helicase [Ekhidna sp.]|nr:DEAD/DEAH box helicase [Ekhidna sp.]MBC6410128.1 DEAD/DEAH box helicase [Ekhidna sp.]MBC6426044.1 DEAD/DEAH box helicase [Ekhidna sp.]
MTFNDFELNASLIEAIDHMGFSEATPIQEQAIPSILKGQDLIACAQTGTGKTAAFVIPTLHYLAEEPSGDVKVLMLCPTRELTIQIDQQIEGFSYYLPAHSIAIYGGGDGMDFAQQKKALTQGSNIVVATPGKLISHLNLGYVKFDSVTHLILDEADRMLDMNFYDDIKKIITYLPNLKQTLMFSATMSPKIEKLARGILKNPKRITLELAKPVENISQEVFKVEEPFKIELITKIISRYSTFESILVFTSTKKKVSEIVKDLKDKGEEAEGISSMLEQDERERILLRFKAKKLRILVATDVLSRGIDIKDINLVINFDVPNDAADYVHRIGRTARAKTRGVAVTLVSKTDNYKMKRIEKLIERELDKLDYPMKR